MLLSFYGIFSLLTLTAQSTNTAKVFTEEAYLNWVKEYHPIIQQAHLLDRVGEAYQLKARGGFDPKFSGTIERKSFDGKTYFTIGDTGFKIPSWLGAEFKAGYTWTNGVFLNQENNLPTAGQAYVGVNWTLGRGLAIDERRAALQKAKLLSQANTAQRQTIVNDLLLAAGKAYWDWVNAYNDQEIHKAALALAEVRLEGVKNSFFQGDKPAIDTLESLIQIQNRQLSLNEAQLNYENAGRILSNFLWYQNELPIEVSDLMRPPTYTNINLTTAILQQDAFRDSLLRAHPTLQQMQFKLQEMEVTRRLKKEQLKPRVDVGFNLLANGLDFVNRPKETENLNALDVLLTENYKVGIKVEMPLFLRKARGDLELVDLKLLDTNLKIRQKRQELSNKLLNYQEQLANTRQQISVNQQVVKNYERLLEAENDKFRFGESSIFLLNSREQKLVEGQLKLVKQLITYQKNRLGVVWAAGQLR